MIACSPGLFYIDEARNSDQEKIINLINESYWEEQQLFFIDSLESRERISRSKFTKLLSDPERKLFALIDEVNKEILGVIVIHFSRESDHVGFELFAMNKKYAGKKLGHVLLEYIENYALSLGKKRIKIEVLAFAKKLIRYYENLGYSLTGKTNTFFHENCVRAKYQNSGKHYLLEMTKDLVI